MVCPIPQGDHNYMLSFNIVISDLYHRWRAEAFIDNTFQNRQLQATLPVSVNVRLWVEIVYEDCLQPCDLTMYTWSLDTAVPYVH